MVDIILQNVRLPQQNLVVQIWPLLFLTFINDIEIIEVNSENCRLLSVVTISVLTIDYCILPVSA